MALENLNDSERKFLMSLNRPIGPFNLPPYVFESYRSGSTRLTKFCLLKSTIPDDCTLGYYFNFLKFTFSYFYGKLLSEMLDAFVIEKKAKLKGNDLAQVYNGGKVI
jgi:hypothetical protein